MKRKIYKLCLKLSPFLYRFSMPFATRWQVHFLRRLGARFGRKPPRYISALSWLDGSCYSQCFIGEGVTISSGVSLLCHDWAADTLFHGMSGVRPSPPLGLVRGIEIGDYSFVGRGAMLMPGTRIGKCCLIGAGAVVRGEIPDYSIVIGNPAQCVGNTRRYVERKIDMLDRNDLRGTLSSTLPESGNE